MSGTIDHTNVRLTVDSLLLRALDLSTAQDPIQFTTSTTLSNGTATGNASQQWSDTRTISASGTEDLDFAGSLTNAFGITLTFAKIKIIYIKASSANTNDVQVTRSALNGVPLFMAAGDGIALAPGEWIVYASPTVGKTVTAATGDLLTITNSAGGTGVTYDIVVIGTD